jgi:protein TonB
METMTVTDTFSAGLYSEQGAGAPPPTTAMGRKWLATAVSWGIHAVILAVVASGILPASHIVQPPPEMVVQMVIEPPPPPPPPPEEIKPLPPSPPVAKAEPPRKEPPPVHRRIEPPKPVPPPEVKAPQSAQPAPAPVPTAPSPDADAPKLPPVSAPEAAPPGPAATKSSPAPEPAVDGTGAKQYLSGIQQLAQQHLVYPPLSLRRGEQGEIHVHVKVNRAGEVLSMDAGEEGTGRLRIAALEAIRESSPFPPLPSSIHGDTVDIVVPVRFIINN